MLVRVDCLGIPLLTGRKRMNTPLSSFLSYVSETCLTAYFREFAYFVIFSLKLGALLLEFASYIAT